MMQRKERQATRQKTAELLEKYSYAGKAITCDDYEYIYLSPHLDDVAFSCSGAICTYRAQDRHVLAVTLFAADPQPPFPPLARACHQIWQVPEGVSPYQMRRAEDEKAMTALDIDYLWLSWPEVIYRAPDLSNFSELNGVQIDIHRDPIFPLLCQWLGDLQATYPQATIVVPLGVGGHRDHRLLFQAALNVLDRATLLFFEDFPYAAYLPEETRRLVRLHNLVPLEVDISSCLEQRIQAASFYESQHAMLFYPPSAFRALIREYAHAGPHNRFSERYWRFAR